MGQISIIVIDLLYAISILALVSAGLALVFGLMRVINLAHGEFIVLGGYTTIVAINWGVSVWVAMFVLAPIVVGLFGLVVERLVIRHLYGRMVDTMLATWGLSLLITSSISVIFGSTTTSVANPLSPVTIGGYQTSGYSLLVIGVTITTYLVMALILKFTKVGLIARAAMQSPEVIANLGYNPSTVYMATFSLGAALSGMAGGILAPLIGLTPTSGGHFIAKSFITVISGGASVFIGTLTASTLFSGISKFVEFLSSPAVGEIALLIAALVLLRTLPQGLTGRWMKGAV